MDELLRALQADLSEPTMDLRVRIDHTADAFSAAEKHAPVQTVSEAGSDTHSATAPPLGLHPGARTNFDAKAEALLSALKSIPDSDVPPVPDPTPPDSKPFAKYLPDHAIQENQQSFRDGEGNLIARSFTHGGMITGFQYEGYHALRRLAEAMQRTGSLRDVVSTASLDELIFVWARDRVAGSTTAPMSDYVLERVAARLASYEAVFPLFRVQLAEPVQIGRVTLRTLTGTDFQRWESTLRHREGDKAGGLTESPLWQARKELQGFATAVLTLRGVPERAIEVGRKKAEEAVAMLRLFSPAILSPVARSFCALSGRENLEATKYLLIRSDLTEILWGADADTETDFVWRIHAERLQLIRREVLDALVTALFEEEPTAFAEEVKSALVLYSQSALKPTPADKLLTVLIPLESLLLKSQTEPIIDHIAVRLALAVGQTLDERKRIVKVAKDAYALRSAYVHHRKSIEKIDDLDTLREFMIYAWRFFLGLGAEAGSYQERAEYLESLDDLKLTYGGSA